MRIGAALFALLFLDAACQRAPTQRPAPARESPRRIASLSPSVTEILYGLGVFDRVVAVSNYCTYPPEVEKLPRVGNWLSANLEQLSELHADVVIMTQAQSQFLRDRLDALGIRTVVVEGQTIADALRAIVEIGRVVGTDTEAARLVAETRAALDDVRRRTASLPRPRVLCVVDRVPGTLRELYTATEGSFLAELIEIAGGRSVAPRSASGYGKITKEALLSLDPEVILDMQQGAKGRLAEDPLTVWRDLVEVRAVRSGRVYELQESTLLHPSQLVAATARRFAEILHPSEFTRESAR